MFIITHQGPTSRTTVITEVGPPYHAFHAVEPHEPLAAAWRLGSIIQRTQVKHLGNTPFGLENHRFYGVN